MGIKRKVCSFLLGSVWELIEIKHLGKYHLLPPGGLLEFGEEHIIFGDKKGEHKIFFS